MSADEKEYTIEFDGLSIATYHPKHLKNPVLSLCDKTEASITTIAYFSSEAGCEAFNEWLRRVVEMVGLPKPTDRDVETQDAKRS